MSCTALMTIFDLRRRLREMTGMELRCSLIWDFLRYHWNVYKVRLDTVRLDWNCSTNSAAVDRMSSKNGVSFGLTLKKDLVIP